MAFKLKQNQKNILFAVLGGIVGAWIENNYDVFGGLIKFIPQGKQRGVA